MTIIYQCSNIIIDSHTVIEDRLFCTIDARLRFVHYTRNRGNAGIVCNHFIKRSNIDGIGGRCIINETLQYSNFSISNLFLEIFFFAAKRASRR